MHTLSIKLYTAILWSFLFSFPAAAQLKKSFAQVEELSLETPVPVIFTVDPKNNTVTKIFIKQEDIERQLYELKEECYRCEYYLGSAMGFLKVLDKKILNGYKTLFTINTSQNLMKGKEFLPGGIYPPGAMYMLGSIKTKVVENKKGVFIVQTF